MLLNIRTIQNGGLIRSITLRGSTSRSRRSRVSSRRTNYPGDHAAYFATITGMPDPIDEHLFAVQREYDDLEAALLQMLPEFREYLAANDSDERTHNAFQWAEFPCQNAHWGKSFRTKTGKFSKG